MMNKWILALSLFGAFRLLPRNIPEIGDSIQDTELSLLTHFSSVSHFYAPWKRQKTFGFQEV